MRTPPDWGAQVGLRHKSRHTAKGRAALCFGPTGGQNRNDASMCSQEPQINFLRNPGPSIQTKKSSTFGCLYGKLSFLSLPPQSNSSECLRCEPFAFQRRTSVYPAS